MYVERYKRAHINSPFSGAVKVLVNDIKVALNSIHLLRRRAVKATAAKGRDTPFSPLTL